MPFSKRFKFLLEYAAFRLTAGLLRLLPWNVSIALGAAIGRTASLVVRKRFSLSLENIRKAFPSASAEQTLEIARQSWANLGVTAAEFAKASVMSKAQLLELFSVRNASAFEQHVSQGKPAIVHLAHTGNWELAGMGVQARYGKVAAVARRIRNPYVDAWVDKARRHFGSEIISHKNPFFSCAKWLKKGKILGILMDQNMPYGEVFLPFFGRMAATTPLTALLALKTGTPVFPVHIYRENGRIVAEVEPPIYPEEGYSEEKVYRIISALNARTESWIKQDPSSWLWAHNRWKRENQAPAARPAGTQA